MAASASVVWSWWPFDVAGGIGAGGVEEPLPRRPLLSIRISDFGTKTFGTDYTQITFVAQGTQLRLARVIFDCGAGRTPPGV